MQSRWSFKRRSTWALIAAPILAMASLTIAAASPAVASPAAASPAAAHSHAVAHEHFTVKPHRVNMLDCNGWSKRYASANPGFRKLCTDPRGPERYQAGYNTIAGGAYSHGRFVDNGHYVGHDEPSVKFISSAAGSGNTMTYYMKMPKDPAKPPTNNGKIVKDLPKSGGFKEKIQVSHSGWYTLYAEGALDKRLDTMYPQASTNAIRVYVGDEKIRDRESAEYFIRWMDKLHRMVADWPWWRSDAEKKRVLTQVDEARAVYERLR